MWPNPQDLWIWSNLLKKSLMKNFIFLCSGYFGNVRMNKKPLKCKCFISWNGNMLSISPALKKLMSISPVPKIHYNSNWWNFQLSSIFLVFYFLVTAIDFGQQIVSFSCVRLSVTFQTNTYTDEWFTSFSRFFASI